MLNHVKCLKPTIFNIFFTRMRFSAGRNLHHLLSKKSLQDHFRDDEFEHQQPQLSEPLGRWVGFFGWKLFHVWIWTFDVLVPILKIWQNGCLRKKHEYIYVLVCQNSSKQSCKCFQVMDVHLSKTIKSARFFAWISKWFQWPTSCWIFENKPKTPRTPLHVRAGHGAAQAPQLGRQLTQLDWPLGAISGGSVDFWLRKSQMLKPLFWSDCWLKWLAKVFSWFL